MHNATSIKISVVYANVVKLKAPFMVLTVYPKLQFGKEKKFDVFVK